MEKPILPSPQDGDPRRQVSGLSPPRSSRVHPDVCCHMASACGPGLPAGWLEVTQV